MTIIRTAAGLTRMDIRRLKRGRFEIRAIETRQLEEGNLTEILWEREDRPSTIREEDIPY